LKHRSRSPTQTNRSSPDPTPTDLPAARRGDRLQTRDLRHQVLGQTAFGEGPGVDDQVGPHQVRVNAVSPGYTETFLVKEFFSLHPPELRQTVLDAHPMGRIGQPAEIAAVVAFLLSSEANYVTGANWLVDGGLAARFAG